MRKMVRQNTPRPEEDEQIQAFMDRLPDLRQPQVKIYRIEENKRHTCLHVCPLDEFPVDKTESALQHWFGAGDFLVRTVRSNGTYGPSRVFHIGDPSPLRY